VAFRITTGALIERYQGLLLDAYGVLLDQSGPLPGAVEFINQLNIASIPYLLLTNSASMLPETMAAGLQAQGLAIPEERILSSGLLLTDYFQHHQLQDAPSLVLGPVDAVDYVRRAGGEPLAWQQADAMRVLVLADQKGFDCLSGMNQALTLVLQALDAGQPLDLLLCNPDLIYPVAAEDYAFTAGGLAAMLEAVLAQRYPAENYHFQRLGKPYAPLFERAKDLLGTDQLVMLGDQLATDIRGALDAGLDATLVGTGLARPSVNENSLSPTWYLPSLQD
jgi:HAD superfamily hydrolase (TIGR01459 family)